MKKIALTAAIAAISASSLVAHAQNTTTFDVVVEILDSCEVSATDMEFWDVDPVQGVSGDDGNGTISITCTTGTTYSVELAYDVLTHTDGTTTLEYGLFSDIGLIDEWNTTDVVTGTGSGQEEPLSVYADIVPGADLPAGTYSDTVTVTVEF